MFHVWELGWASLVPLTTSLILAKWVQGVGGRRCAQAHQHPQNRNTRASPSPAGSGLLVASKGHRGIKLNSENTALEEVATARVIQTED